MTIRSRRLEMLGDRVAEGYIKQGYLPDATVLEADLEALTVNKDLDAPFLDSTEIDFRSLSDVSTINTLQQGVGDDMLIPWREFVSYSSEILDNLFVYDVKSKEIISRVAQLRDRIGDLLLLADDVEGYLYSVYDTFLDTSKVDNLNTTALVDLTGQLVTLQSTNLTTVVGTTTETDVLDLSFLTVDDVTFHCLNTSAVASIKNVSLRPLTDIFNNKLTAYQTHIYLNAQQEVVCELKVKIDPLTPVTISQIELETQMSVEAEQLLIQAQYSADNFNWKDLPISNYVQYVEKKGKWAFSPLEMQYVKFIITKQSYDFVDGGSYVYEVGIRNITFMALTYAYSNILRSSALSVSDESGQSIPLNKVACEVCENVPDQTSIDYYVGVLRENEIDFVPISSLDDPEPKHAKRVNLHALSELDQLIETTGYGGGAAINWTPSGNYYVVALSDVMVAGGANPSGMEVIPDSIELYRQIGPSGSNYMEGWSTAASGVHPEVYKTYVQVYNPDGYMVEVGDNPVFIDNSHYANSVLIPNGLHQVSTASLHDNDWLHATAIAGVDEYFAQDCELVSYHDFTQNRDQDPSVMAYSSGCLYIHPYSSFAQDLPFSPANSFTYDNRYGGYYSNTNTSIATTVSYIPGEPLSTAPSGSPLPTTPSGVSAGDFVRLDFSYGYVNEVQFLREQPCRVQILHMEDETEDDTLLDNWTPLVTAEFGEATAPLLTSMRLPMPLGSSKLLLSFLNGEDGSPMYGTVIEDLRLFAPRRLISTVVSSDTIYLPEGNVWNTVTASPETGDIVYIYDVNDLETPLLSGAPPLDLTSIRSLTAEIVIKSAHLYNLEVNTIAQEEMSRIKFNYYNPDNEQLITEVYFKAELKTENNRIAPELKSYRLKFT